MSHDTSKVDVEDFVSRKTLAIVGVSRNPKKFGNMAFRELQKRGYRLLPVNRNVNQIDGTTCYPDLRSLPEKVDAVVIVVPPKETEQVVREADEAGIQYVWMQQGSQSDAAIQYCQQHGIREVHGECILMFAGPVHSYHRLHRGIYRIFGKMPQ